MLRVSFWQGKARLLALVLPVLLAHVWVLDLLARWRLPATNAATPAMRWTLHAPAATRPVVPLAVPGAAGVSTQAAVAPIAPGAGPRRAESIIGRAAVSAELALPKPTPAPVPIALAAPMRLEFAVHARVRGQALLGQSEWTWLHDGQQYQARVEVSGLPSGARVQSSVGKIGAEGLRPERYADKARTERAAHFERDQGQVIFSANRPAATLADGMQDRLSVVFQLAGLLAAAPGRYTVGTVLELPVATPREALTWRFNVADDELLELPAGALQARRLTRIPQREYEPTLDLWFGVAQGFQPVRMRVTQANGDFVDQLLQASALTR